jgi:hypothetical protein
MSERRLSNRAVTVIRSLYESGIGVFSIARDFNIHCNRVRDICDPNSRVEKTKVICSKCGREFEVVYIKGGDIPQKWCESCIILWELMTGRVRQNDE